MTQPQLILTPTHFPAASRGARVGAYLIDLVCLLGFTGCVWWVQPSWGLVVIVVIQLVVVLSLIKARTGRSPGALVMGTATLTFDSDRAPGLARQCVRTLVLGALQALLVGPLVAIALIREGRDWVDRVSGTATVDRRNPVDTPGVQPSQAMTAPSLSPASSPQLVSPMPRPTLEVHSVPFPGPAPWAVPPADPPQNPPVDPPPKARHADSETSTAPEEEVSFSPRRAVPQSSSDRPYSDRFAPTTWPNSFPTVQSSPGAGAAIPTTLRPAAAFNSASPAAASSPAKQRSGAEAWIVTDSGHQEPINTVVVLGRDPVAQAPHERLVALPDPTHSISRTHARFGPAPGGAWVEDTGSTNGSRIQASSGTLAPLEPRRRVMVPFGTTVMLGDRSVRILPGRPSAP